MTDKIKKDDEVSSVEEKDARLELTQPTTPQIHYHGFSGKKFRNFKVVK